MKYLNLFEEFEFKKNKKIKKHYKGERSGVVNVLRKVGSIINYKEPLKDILDTVCKKFSINKVKYADSGSFGMAFIADDNKIIKLTSNRSEAVAAKKTIGKEIPSCIRYYDVTFLKKYNIYAILMDKADKISRKEKSAFDIIFIGIDDDEGYFRTADKKSIKHLIDSCKNPNMIYPTGELVKPVDISKEEAKIFIEEYIDLVENLKNNKISTNDAHSNNLGRVNGKLVHFDIGGLLFF